MPLDPEQRKAREFIEHVWRTKHGYANNIEMVGSEQDWSFFEELLLTDWNETKKLIGRNG